MVILVTGGTGYIGSHTCVELLDRGHEVVVFDNLSNSSADVIDRIEQISGRRPVFYRADMIDMDSMRPVFERHKFDAVIHFAALKSVGESVQKPIEYYRNNVAGTINLCDMMREYGCRRIIFSSSATVYGAPATVPVREDFPLSATNPYGAAKLMVERILRDICVSDPEWSVVLLRYFNPIGAHGSGLIGEMPNGIPNNLLPYVAQVAAGKLPHLNIFGTDYPTPDGTGIRDYIHVCDLAAGHVGAIRKVMNSTGVSIYNLGTGKGYSVLEIVHAFEKATGISIPCKPCGRRPGDIAVCYADATRAREELGWAPRFDIDQMCHDAWNFTKKQFSVPNNKG
ncbi:MAG: UDP-glucose 4-epimerase GalE [Proteobacteria bacterium]|nr:UDP-glucose 4-epimerase GalE [Pseudomonadota bacterium]